MSNSISTYSLTLHGPCW